MGQTPFHRSSEAPDLSGRARRWPKKPKRIQVAMKLPLDVWAWSNDLCDRYYGGSPATILSMCFLDWVGVRPFRFE